MDVPRNTKSIEYWIVGLAISFSLIGCIDSRQLRSSSTQPVSWIEELIAASTAGKTLSDKPIPTDLVPSEVDTSRVITYLEGHPDSTSYHLLFLLRQYRPKEYLNLSSKLRAQILVAGLANVHFLNDWGTIVPDFDSDDVAAQELLQIGEPAMPYLRVLLDNQLPAILVGSEAAYLSKVYEYRRCDFAYRYMMLIRKTTPEFPKSVVERDRLIAALKQEVDGN